MKAVVSIAGSDSSGGAGIQADIKTIAAHHLFAETVITALTAQNTLGVTGVHEVPAAFVSEQIDAVFSDIRPDAVKVGMVSSAEIIRAIAGGLDKWHAENIVVDPVMVATSGARLIGEDAVSALIEELLPRASVITPNIPEAQVLCGCELSDEESCERAAVSLARSLGVNVLVKGGHGAHDANDVLATRSGETHWFRHEAIPTTNTHGRDARSLLPSHAVLPAGYPFPTRLRRPRNTSRVHSRRASIWERGADRLIICGKTPDESDVSPLPFKFFKKVEIKA